MQDRPQARTEGIVSEQVDTDVVVYDEATSTAHSLSAAAASVWALCDGEHTQSEMAEELNVAPELISRAVDEIANCGLLEESPSLAGSGMSRRDAAKRIAQVGGAAFAAPMIYSVAIAPAMAAASTCTPNANGTTMPGTATCTGTTSTGPGHCCGACYRDTGNDTTYCAAAGCNDRNTDVGNGNGGTCCSGACTHTTGNNCFCN